MHGGRTLGLVCLTLTLPLAEMKGYHLTSGESYCEACMYSQTSVKHPLFKFLKCTFDIDLHEVVTSIKRTRSLFAVWTS